MAVAAQSPEEEASRLLEAARYHKRAARRHREQAQQKMAQLKRVIELAAQRGIDIQINTAEPGGHSGHRADRTAACQHD
jgi:hypothetical protein